MLKIAIITNVAGKSSDKLADIMKFNGLSAKVFRMNKIDHNGNFSDYDWVFSYGCSSRTIHKNRINSREGVLSCVNKPLSFNAMQAAKVKTVEYCTQKPIPKHWDWVVVREDVNGRRAQGMEFFENGPNVPYGELYSEYFEHRYEYRIVVFMGKVVGRYYKREEGKDWDFKLQPASGFELMDKHCIKAAKAIGIDYCGFDVLANTKRDFRIIEANSGPIITDEAENAITEYFINL